MAPVNSSNSTRLPSTNTSSMVSSEDIIKLFQEYSNGLQKYAYKWVLLVLYILILVSGCTVNLLLIYVIQRLRNPKSLSNRTMLIIRVLCDLALICIGVPYTAYTAVHKNWQLGDSMCKTSAFAIYFIVALNNFLLVAICLNRSVAISQNDKHLTDPATNVPCRVKCLLCAAVLAALMIALPGSLVTKEEQVKLPESIEYLVARQPELIPRLCVDTWSREAQLAYDVVLIIFIYLLPLFVVCLSQHIVTVHLKQSQRLLMLMGHQTTLAWTRRRQRLTRLCVLMAALFVLSWSPNHVCNLLTKIFHINNYATEILLDYSMCLALSNAVTGPVLLIVTCSVYSRFIVRMAGRLSSCCWCLRSVQLSRMSSIGFRSSLSVCTPMDLPCYTEPRSRVEPGYRDRQHSTRGDENMLMTVT